MNYHSLSDYRGKVVVIDFFGVYCGYCKEDSKNLAALYSAYYQRDSRVQFLCIASDSGPTAVHYTGYRAMVYNYVQYAGIPQNVAQYTVLVGGQRHVYRLQMLRNANSIRFKPRWKSCKGLWIPHPYHVGKGDHRQPFRTRANSDPYTFVIHYQRSTRARSHK